jgi:ribosomal protein S18 acetylase RimI-like enzyme
MLHSSCRGALVIGSGQEVNSSNVNSGRGSRGFSLVAPRAPASILARAVLQDQSTDVTEIRRFLSSDRQSVLHALIEAQNHEMQLHDTRLPGETVAAAYLDRMLDDVEAGGGMLFVAEQDAAFVGFVGCLVVEDDVVQETPDSNRYGYIKDIFVDPRHRGRGVAQRLLVAAERYLAGTGVTRLRLNVLANNLTARRAYRRYGFADYEVIYEKRIGTSNCT